MHKNFITPINKREDAFTADNLQDLYLLNPFHFTIFDFTPYIESRISGADWEMWFIDTNGSCCGFAVQAKKLSADLDYDINYTPKKSKVSQVDRLISYCRGYKDLTPLYCFYNYFRNVNSTVIWPCKSSLEHETLWGCTIAHGINIKKLINLGKNSVDDVLPLCFPWHCMVCCPVIRRDAEGVLSSRAAGFADLLQKLGPAQISEAPDEQFENPRILSKLPERIQAVRASTAQGLRKDIIDRYWKKHISKYIVLIEEK